MTASLASALHLRLARAAAVVALLATACVNDIREPLPGTVVATYPSPTLDLAGHLSYVLPARLGQVTSEATGPTYVEAPALLAAVARNLDARGFVKAADIDPQAPPAGPPAADLAVNLTALDSVDAGGGHWVAFPGYLQPDDLGYPGFGWGTYPWTWLPMANRAATLLVEVCDLANRAAGSGGSPGTIPVVWAALAFEAGAGGYDSPAAIAAIDRAFAQSPYLRIP